MNYKTLVVLVFIIVHRCAYGQSVFDTGNWLKLEVADRGMYKVTAQDLSNAGVPVGSIDPKTIKLYGYLAGTLPQPNATERPFDPFEIPVIVSGEDDGRFDNTDYLLFYAQSAHTYRYSGTQLTYHYNPYADKNYYFITYGGNPGQRVQPTETAGEAATVITTYDDFRFYKKEQNNLLTSGRTWYSERFSSTLRVPYTFGFENLISGSAVKVTVSVMAQSFQNAFFNIYESGQPIGTIEVPSIPNFRERRFRYAVKGAEATGVFTTAAGGSASVVLEVEYRQSGEVSTGYLNNILVETKNELRFRGGSLLFRALESTENEVSRYRIENAPEAMMVWDVTDPYVPVRRPHSLAGGAALFSAPGDTLRELVAFDPASVSTPLSLAALPAQNLKGLTDVVFLIVAHEQFLAEAERLALFRQQHDGLRSEAVALSLVYNEFSAGRQDVTAIRDMAKYLYDNGALKYLLLFGRGSYDYKDIAPNNTNFVPIYESRNSLHPLETYASDDYYGFLEDDEGEWAETGAGAHTMDIGVGRLPVTDEEEAMTVVNKIINYTTNPETIGKWRNEVVFVADDGDFNLHQRQADQFTVFIDTTYAAFEPRKFYLDNFEQLPRAGGETSPQASEALGEVVENGALIVNFTGHGGETGWMQERVLDVVQIESWTNYNRLPLFVTATCEFGRHDDPRRISAGELVVSSPRGGGIAIVSTCRPVNASSNFNLNKAFYEVAYRREGGNYLRLGDIFRLTKSNEKANSIGNRNFALLGDPTLRLTYPAQNIVVTTINGSEAKTDTLKAQSRVTLTGEVRAGDGPDGSFNGTVQLVVYDKAIDRVTLGNENEPFTYKAKDNIIFRGSSSVVDGRFEVGFIVPKNISYKVGRGEVNMYAYSDDMRDANGSDAGILIGASAEATSGDEEGPAITLYMGDTLNNDLSSVSHNTNLVVRLADESGINLSGFGMGNSITARLDDAETFVLNSYYEADRDTYQSGYLSFPLRALAKGPHSITVTASDVYNNASEATIRFNVADPGTIVIYDLKNYPNPFNFSTRFAVRHNRAGENLELTLEIISPHAGVVAIGKFAVEDAPSDLVFYEWNGTNEQGIKLMPGMYIYKVTVRSVRDGAQNAAYRKLILR